MKKITALLSLALTIAPLALFSDDDIPVLDMRSPFQTATNIADVYISRNNEEIFSYLSSFLVGGGLLAEKMYVDDIENKIGTIAHIHHDDHNYPNYYTYETGCHYNFDCRGCCDYGKDWALYTSDPNGATIPTTYLSISYPQYEMDPNTYGIFGQVTNNDDDDVATLLATPITIGGTTYTHGRFVNTDTKRHGLAHDYYYKKNHNIDLTKSYICKRWAAFITGSLVHYALYAGLIKGAHTLYKKLRPIKKDGDSSQDTEKFDAITENPEIIENSKETLNNFEQ